jgi:hypothetical protein
LYSPDISKIEFGRLAGRTTLTYLKNSPLYSPSLAGKGERKIG